MLRTAIKLPKRVKFTDIIPRLQKNGWVEGWSSFSSYKREFYKKGRMVIVDVNLIRSSYYRFGEVSE